MAQSNVISQSSKQNQHTLSDLVVYDIYQVDPKHVLYKHFKDEIGFIAFIYREIAGCPPEINCRTRALVWISPNGDTYELPLAEEYLSAQKLNLQLGGVGLGSKNTFDIFLPANISTRFGQSLKLDTTGTQGEFIDLNTGFGNSKLEIRWKRVLSVDSQDQIYNLATLSAKIRRGAYFPVRVAAFEPKHFTVFHREFSNNSTQEIRGIILARPPDRTQADKWSLSIFSIQNWNGSSTIPSGEFKLLTHLRNYEYGPIDQNQMGFYKPEPGIAGFSSIGGGLGALLDRQMDQMVFQARPQSQIPGVGKIIPSITNNLKLFTYDLNRVQNPQIDSDQFQSTQDIALSEFVVNSYTQFRADRAYRNAYYINVDSNPFFDMLYKAAPVFASCNQFLSPSHVNNSGPYTSMSSGGFKGRMPPIPKNIP